MHNFSSFAKITMVSYMHSANYMRYSSRYTISHVNDCRMMYIRLCAGFEQSTTNLSEQHKFPQRAFKNVSEYYSSLES